MIKLGILQALRRWDRDDAPFADLGFECQRGRHRSTFAGEMLGYFLEDTGFPVEIRFHHARALGDIDTRGLCGCGEGHCTFQGGRDLRPESRWQQEQKQARKDCSHVTG
eukprot:8764867-Alexandrium_andersonii.AAC.1